MSLDHIEDAYALSPIQSGMLYDSLATPDTDVYVTYVTVDIVGEYDAALLHQAWVNAYAKHQSLRAAFLWDGLDEPLQVINKVVHLPWSNLDWSTESDTSKDQLMEELVHSERAKRFDLAEPPLSRFNLIKLNAALSRLLWSVHHLLADGLSTPTILEDVLEQYTLLSGQPSGTFSQEQADVYQYGQYIQWLAQQDQSEANAFWQGQLKGAVPTPTRFPTKIISEQNNLDKLAIPQVKFELSAAQTTELNLFCQSHRITLSTFLHGAWALLLREYSGCDASLFASTVSGRHAEVVGMDRAVGLYLNAQPRWIETGVQTSLVSWLQAVQTQIHQSAQYDFSSLAKIQEYVETDAEETQFESIITIGGHPSELDLSRDDYDLTLTNIHYQSTQSHYPLAFLAFPGEVLEMSLVYDSSRYLVQDISNMSLYLHSLIQTMLTSADESPAQVCANSAIATSRNGKDAQFDFDDHAERTVHGWIESVVDSTPDATALRFNGESVSFRQLDERANQIAHYISEQLDPAASAPIGLMLPRGIDQIAALLGILKSGHAYVPIDVEFPESIIRSYIATAEITHVIATAEIAHAMGSSALSILTVDSAASASKQRVTHVQVDSTSLAYVMFTSGSTGVPKGVQISHANLIYSTESRFEYYGYDKPTYLLLSSIAFDSSVAGIYWSLCSGGTLVLPKPNEEKDIQSISQMVHSESVTHTLCLPSYYQVLLQLTDTALLKKLRVVIVAGEACTADLVQLHFELRSTQALFNEYGPTEACVWSSVHSFEHAKPTDMPIGKPIGSTFLNVLNQHGNLCPPGTEGEIVIGGLGLSPGYINESVLNDEKFVPNPIASTLSPRIYKTGDLGYWNTHNELVFTGRVDRQLKIRGHRIEPGAVEAVLNKIDGIDQSVVIAIDQHVLSDVVSEPASHDDLLKQLQSNFSADEIEQAMASLGLLAIDSESFKTGLN